MSLGLTLGDLNAIKFQNESNVRFALTKVLSIWLQQNYDVQRHGHPTWRKLVAAVADPAGGNNKALADNIASSHSKGI